MGWGHAVAYGALRSCAMNVVCDSRPEYRGFGSGCHGGGALVSSVEGCEAGVSEVGGDHYAILVDDDAFCGVEVLFEIEVASDRRWRQESGVGPPVLDSV